MQGYSNMEGVFTELPVYPLVFESNFSAECGKNVMVSRFVERVGKKVYDPVSGEDYHDFGVGDIDFGKVVVWTEN